MRSWADIKHLSEISCKFVFPEGKNKSVKDKVCELLGSTGYASVLGQQNSKKM